MGRIIVLGSLNVDLVVAVSRLPRPGETVLGGDLRTFPGGKGANQAVAAARLGGNVAMVGRVGTDAFGGLLLDSLAGANVDVRGIERDANAPTGAALIFVEESGENVIAVAPGANRQVAVAEVERSLAGMKPDDLLILQLEIPMATVQDAVARCPGRVLLNAAPPAPLDEETLSHLDVLVVNEIEAEALFGIQVKTADGAAAAARRAQAAGVALAIVTMGQAGAVFSDDKTTTIVEPFHVTPVDTTAAGDAFVGALAVALANGQPASTAVRLANAAGAAATTHAGAQSSLPFPEDLRRLLGSASV